jgi:hypothetical protein
MIFSIKREFIRFEDKLLEVVRSFREDHIKDVEAVKRHYECTTVLRKNGFMYFCTEVPEAEIIEDESISLPESPSEESLSE